MKMETESERLNKILESLRISRPLLVDKEAVTDRIIQQIESDRTSLKFAEIIYDFLFGWVYIGWMRRIMVASALFLTVLFGFQQAMVIKKINQLSGQIYSESGAIKTDLPAKFPGVLKIYRFMGKSIVPDNTDISEKEIDKLIESINELQIQYRDLLEIIENNPQLKKNIEQRLYNQETQKPKI